MNRQIATFFFENVTASEAGKEAPLWVQLFPAGPVLKARDGREWRLSDPQIVLTEFKKNDGPLAIDYEHGQNFKAMKGEMAPAAGWIQELDIRGGEIWGRVEWTEKAETMIKAREYRFLSPEFSVSKDNDEIIELLGAGLVNRPALKMAALAARTINQKMENTMEGLAAINKVLSLDEASDIPSVIATLQKQRDMHIALCKKLSLNDDSNDEAILTALQSMMASMVPQSELTALASRLKKAEAEIAASKVAEIERKIKTVLDAATQAGKITPASREHYHAMCKRDGGLDDFQKLVATLPAICEPSASFNEKPASSSPSGNNDVNAIVLAARKHQKEQEKLGNSVPWTQAVLAVAEGSE